MKYDSYKRYRLPEGLAEDVTLFFKKVEDFKRGDLSLSDFRAFRAARGVYEERQDGEYMLRVRLPGGGLTAHQMRLLSQTAKQFGKSLLHLTTRQDVQLHRLPLENISPAMEQLLRAELVAKGGGGNTVRNITACSRAGGCCNAVFDVLPFATQLTEVLLTDPASFTLPRKYKIAFSGCSRDCAGAGIQDLGFIAKLRNGVRGFSVYVAGGLGARSRIAELLEEFVPASSAALIAEAIKRIFDKHGDRENRGKARLRFLVEKIGSAEFQRLYREELSALDKNVKVKNEEILSQDLPETKKPSINIEIPLLFGDINSEQMASLADIVDAYGQGWVQVTPYQNMIIPGIHEDKRSELLQKIEDLGLKTNAVPILHKIVSCVGASTCRLGVCPTRNLIAAIAQKLESINIDVPDLAIHISGCPNSCGRHSIAPIGLFGVMRQIDGQSTPHFVVQLGGRLEEGKNRLAKGTHALPESRIPSFLADLLSNFTQSKQYPDFYAFLEANEEKIVCSFQNDR
jgi:sulfite reductase (ferredoxin)